MYCKKCGKEIGDNMKFCPFCGAGCENPQKTGVWGGQKAGPAPERAKRRRPAVIAACAAIVCMAAVLGIVLRKPTISLNQYLTVEFEGVEGYGTASASFDYDKMLSDNRNKIKGAEDSLFSSKDLLTLCIDGALDETEGLSNGDTVTFSWACDEEEALDSFGVKLKYSDEEFTAEGLEEMETRDLFEDFEVVFSGTSPMGEANVNMNINHEYTSSLYYKLDRQDGLSNGDSVTLTLYIGGDYDINQFFAERFGFIPESTQKTYIVEGLESYAQSLTDISEDAIEKMKAQGEDAFASYTAQKWEEEAMVDEIGYCGSYFLVNKDPSNCGGAVNQLYLVYHVKSTLDTTTSGGDKNFKASPEFYWYVCYEDLMVGTEGETIVDVSDYETVKDSFKVYADNSSSWGSAKAWSYEGYETLEDLEYAVVTANREAYDSEKNIGSTEP